MSEFSLAQSKRLVVKIGTALLTDPQTGDPRRAWMTALAEDAAALAKSGTQVLIVTSGAVAIGRHALGLLGRSLKLEEKQAAAATGQIGLFAAWQEAFAAVGMPVAQILLTPGDTEERRRHLNARGTIEALFGLRAVPVINENDTVATDELRFGDNDRLAARVAQMVGADALVLLSDIDGLYTADPRRVPDAEFMPEIGEITAEIEAMAGEAAPGYASGGMVTKIEAARIATRAGCSVIITNGAEPHRLSQIGKTGRHTLFRPNAEPATARKRWIAGAVQPAGAITVDDGAKRALAAGKSLLPAGVVSVEGSFERGDAVIIRTADGKRIGTGLIAYSAEDARIIAGHKSREIEEQLGYRGRDEMIHRDDLALDG